MTDYKLMPKQITKEMADAFWEEYSKDSADDLLMRCYKAMYLTAPALQPAEQPVSWIHISRDRVILSRCNWMYPASTEDSAGPRDEQRFTAVGRRDGDIVLPAPEGSLDREDMETMLAWPSASESVEQKSDTAQLVEALELALEYWADRQQRYKNRSPMWVNKARSALAANRKQGGDE